MATATQARARWRNWLHAVIFGTESRFGRGFDILLLVAIIASVFVVMLESVSSVEARYGELLLGLEIVFTILFSLEYLLRLASSMHAVRYAKSFFGIIDLLSILPTYLFLFFAADENAHGQALLMLRSLRLLRMFRVFKLTKYMKETVIIASALKHSREKILVFFTAVLTVVMVMGTVMYLIEGPEHGFDSIPIAIYWAIITVTTVGYGDISPETPLGKTIAAVGVLVGYAIIAVPTGIVTSEFERARKRIEKDSKEKEEAAEKSARYCQRCGEKILQKSARYCSSCGEKLVN